MEVERRRVQQVAYGLAVVCASILLFWCLPILTWRNSWGFSERLSTLPGISQNGGIQSGIATALYISLGVVVVASTVVGTVGVPAVIESPQASDTNPSGTTPGADNGTEATPTPTTGGNTGTGENNDSNTGENNDNSTESAEILVELNDVPETVTPGDAVDLVATVENVGNSGTIQEITFNGSSESVGLAPGDTDTVRFTWIAQNPGIHNLTVSSQNDSATVTVEVIKPTPNFEVDIVGTNAPVSDREPLDVTAQITNNGTAGATQQINLTRQQFREDTTNVTLASGASTNVTLTWEPATPHGEHELRVASANDSARQTVTIEPVNESAVAGQVFIMEEGEVADAGVVNLYDAEGEELLRSVDLAQTNGSYRFPDLEPGTEYTLTVPSAIGTLDNGLDVDSTSFPAAEYTVTATEIQQSVPLTYGFEFQGADYYRWEHWLDADLPDQHWLGEAKYADGEANITERYIQEWTDGFDPELNLKQWYVYVNSTSYRADNGPPEGIWEETPEYEIMKPVSLPHQIVGNPAAVLSELEWEYEGREIPGKHIGTQKYAYEYELTGFESAGFEPYSEVTIYIDSDTGHVIHWQSDKHDRNPTPGLADRFGELRFYDHGDRSITVESPRNKDSS
jgi:hypothetical protein